MKNKSLKIIFSMILILVLAFANNARGAQEINIGNEENKRFKEHVVFYPQHQDDEVLLN